MSKYNSLSNQVPIEKGNVALERREDKCIHCGICKKVCTEKLSVCGFYNLDKNGDHPICLHCGQCINSCPTGALSEDLEYPFVKEAIDNKDKIVIFSISPSVRTSLGEEFNMADGTDVEGKAITLLRKLGGDYILDTNFSADLTVMEEASELIERITNKSKPLPQMTSCCPAWVKFVEIFYPEMIPNLSSVRSPIGMQGATIKTYFAEKMHINPVNIVNVCVTPCTAKKFEIRREEMNKSSIVNNMPMRDMDYCITVRELAKIAKEKGIDFTKLEDGKFDKFMGESSGAGDVFGATGGVMEASLRTAYKLITKKNPPKKLLNLKELRGNRNIKEATINIGEIELRVCVVYGTACARSVIEDIKSNKREYDFIEVMACPSGCIGGGGQPKKMAMNEELLSQRANVLYDKDKNKKIRFCHENPEIIALYKDFYKEPLSNLAKLLLHTNYTDRSDELK
ncbi:MAG: [FeFe] hydrogenase, group A [Clostridia bacterium]